MIATPPSHAIANYQNISGSGSLNSSSEQSSPLNLPAKDEDIVSISQRGREQSEKTDTSTIAQPRNPTGQANENRLDAQELQQLNSLKQRDREVRTHEQAHLSTAGQYARGGASFTFQKGPDGNSYAVGGEAGIDVGKERSPEATVTKMRTIKRAALAPANPSQTDRHIAAQAAVKEAQANKEILQQKQEELLQSESQASPLQADETTIPPKANEGQVLDSSFSNLKIAIAAYENATAM